MDLELSLPLVFFFSPFLWVLSFYNLWQGFIIMTHIEDKHAKEEHQGVIVAICYFKFWVKYNCQTIKKQNKKMKKLMK
jgi:hypothetical protein